MATPSDDLDALIGELNAELEGAPALPDGADRFHEWIAHVHRHKGSDLLLVSGNPPVVRIDGRLSPIGTDVLDEQDIESVVMAWLPAHAIKQYRAVGITDASLRIAGLGRFRVNLHHERGRAAAAIRILPSRVPQLS